MVPHRGWFESRSFRVLNPPRRISFGGDSTVHAVGIGTVIIRTHVGTKQYDIALSDVLLVPVFTLSLISVYKIGRTRLSTSFLAKSDICEIRKGSCIVLTAHHKRGLHHIKGKPMPSLDQANAAGIDTLTGTPEFCEPCVLGKLKKLPFTPTSGNCAERPIQIIHMDVGEPITPISREGFCY
ncbi:uncharacterized protein EDB91DRAFT_1019279, partial [Suillus paluster]|uniref:uncharacterized protein n=1 Tax=Suillus paluster TaxID=48578 RepID=UPI001B87DAE6